MKKTLLSAAFIAICLSASAQKMNFIPWTENGYLTGTTMSDNGKYIAGSDRGGQAFIYNTETGKIQYFKSKELADGGEYPYTIISAVRSVDNNGVGVGYVAEQASKFNFDTGNWEVFKNTDGCAGLFNYISSDNSMAGMRWDKSFYRWPFIIDKDGNEKTLPLPSPSWFGWEEFQGGGVLGGNTDGSVLVGYIMDNFLAETLTFWIKNYNDDNYSVVPMGKQYYDGSFDLDGDQPFDYMGDNDISSNGKWVAITYHKKDDTTGGYKIARYNVITDHMEYIDCPLSSGTVNYSVTGISDEGTIVGYIQDASLARKGIIVKGDESEAKLLADVYPDVKEWKELDDNQANTPCHITPDGRYISGFGYVDLDETNLCYGTYWFDTEGTTSVNSVKTENSSKIETAYSIDGKKSVRTAPNNNGIVINKYANGEVKKILK